MKDGQNLAIPANGQSSIVNDNEGLWETFGIEKDHQDPNSKTFFFLSKHTGKVL
jgi:hypothetical protein